MVYWRNNGDCGIATTWRGLGPAWKYVYTIPAFVDARGLSQQFPTDMSHKPGRALKNVDPCVNLENKEVVTMMCLVFPMIPRAEL